MLRHHSRARLRLRHDVDGPEVAVVDVLQRHAHDAASPIDVDAAEELQAETGREVLALSRATAVLIHRDRAKGVVELARAPGAGMQRTGDEFPERLETLKL